MTKNLDGFKAIGAIGVLLSLLGIFFYLVSGGSSITSLIPSFFGLGFIGLAYFATRQANKRVSLISIISLGVLAALGSVMGLFDLIRMITGADIARPMGALAQTLMFLSAVAVVWIGSVAYKKR